MVLQLVAPEGTWLCKTELVRVVKQPDQCNCNKYVLILLLEQVSSHQGLTLKSEC